jgi:Ca-activated chloride channel family protein
VARKSDIHCLLQFMKAGRKVEEIYPILRFWRERREILMRTATLYALCFLVLFCMVSFAPNTYSDGIIIPPPEVQIAIKYHKVSVSIDSQVAVTKVDQVFVNLSHREIEGTYIFPLPPGAVVSGFRMKVGDQWLEPELLDSDEARRIYEDIVRRRKDPALLEYIGRGAFKMRVFPIAPLGEKRIQLEYYEDLPYDAGLCRYQYPLNTEKFSARPLEMVEVAIDLRSQRPIMSIWSPSHEDSIEVERQGDYSARIVYADEYTTPDIDFTLYYTVSEEDFGLNLITYREPPEDGFYALMAAPNYEISDDEIVGKNVVFVFDTSGSMGRENRIVQAREALEFCVGKLNEGDQFNIIKFSSTVDPFEPRPVSAGAAEVQAALQYIEGLDALGGTNINDALLEALKQLSLATNPLNVIIFLTDGEPTVGVRSNEEIIKNVGSANNIKARLFTFGVGYEVNTQLLDGLAEDNGGVSTYVRPGEDIEIEVSSFFAKVSNPVLSDVELDFGAINTFDRYPTQLPDLFAGSQLKEFGRYRNSGGTIITLSGMAGGKVKEFGYQARFPADSRENDFIPRIWAARKIGYLIDEVRRNGPVPELVEEIRTLSLKYGIINEYVSMLILEDEPMLPEEFAAQFDDVFGEGAVDASVGIRGFKEANVAPSGAQAEDVKIVGSRIFVKKGEIWTDAEYKESQPAIRIQYASDGYFNLAAQNPEIGKYLALGTNVTFYYDGDFYQVQDSPVETPKWDLDGNGTVDVFDLTIVAINFGNEGGKGDVNGDGRVDIVDLALVAAHFGQ